MPQSPTLIPKPPPIDYARLPKGQERSLGPVRDAFGKGLGMLVDGLLGAAGINDPLAPDATPATGVGSLVGLLGPAAMAGGLKRVANPIKAYHGSPHNFDAFDLSKIGTGEGAQAYRHGLYFAENPDVARTYRDALSTFDASKRADGADISYPMQQLLENSWQAVNKRANTKPTMEMALDFADQSLLSQRQSALKAQDFDWFDKVENLRLEVERLRTAPPKTGGHLYEVNLHVRPEELLDWNTTGGPAQEKMLQAIQKQSVDPSQFADLDVKNMDEALQRIAQGDTSDMLGTAEDFLRKPNGQLETDVLKPAGIPGLRYRYGRSFDTGKNEHNYVIWDPDRIEIFKKLGLLPPIGAAALQQAQPKKGSK